MPQFPGDNRPPCPHCNAYVTKGLKAWATQRAIKASDPHVGQAEVINLIITGLNVPKAIKHEAAVLRSEVRACVARRDNSRGDRKPCGGIEEHELPPPGSKLYG